MIEKYIHLTYISKSSWGKPILSIINSSIQKGKKHKKFPDNENILLYISIRLDMLNTLHKRIIEDIKNITEETKIAFKKNPNCEFTNNDNNGYGLDISDDIKYNFLLDVNSLLFELNSCQELTIKFSKVIYFCANKKFDKNGLIAILEKNSEYYKLLYKLRNHFIHGATPYLAIERTNNAWNLLIIKDHDNELNSKNTISLENVDKIIIEFYKNLNLLQEHLKQLFN